MLRFLSSFITRSQNLAPSVVSIQMPGAALFTGTDTSTAQEAYYSTMLHELGHWTGAEARLNRTRGKRFGDRAYAYEELVAELTAAFLCNDLLITVTPAQITLSILRAGFRFSRKTNAPSSLRRPKRTQPQPTSPRQPRSTRARRRKGGGISLD